MISANVVFVMMLDFAVFFVDFKLLSPLHFPRSITTQKPTQITKRICNELFQTPSLGEDHDIVSA